MVGEGRTGSGDLALANDTLHGARGIVGENDSEALEEGLAEHVEDLCPAPRVSWCA